MQLALRDQPRAWRVTPATDRKHPWILAEPAARVLPDQGWKLHVASYGSTAAQTLRRVLPAIAARGIAFKVLGSIAWLRQINRGSAGLSQVGKFLTVYPRDDDDAVQTALALAEAARGLRGPEILSDRGIEEGGVVHYRYGAFGASEMQTRLGEITPALTDPDGRLVPDRRAATAHHPAWVEDPFAARGLGAPTRLATDVAGRYHPVLTLSQSPGVLVQLALDVLTPRACVLKRVRLRGPAAVSHDDPAARVRREGTLLAEIADLAIAPRIYDVVDDGGELTLVMEDLGTDTAERYVGALSARGHRVPARRVIELGCGLADALAGLHDHGHLHGDLKSANVVIASDGRLRLIDFDLAHPIGSNLRAPGAGTRGYTSAACRDGAPAAVADDIHALGAVLYFLATGAEPSRAPDAASLMSRPAGVVNPAAGASLVAVIERCLSDDPGERFGTARGVWSALLECLGDVQGDPGRDVPGEFARDVQRDPGRDVQGDPGRTTVASAPAADPTADAALRWARAAADHICAQAEPSDHGLHWRSRYYRGSGLLVRDVSSGMAGTILALAELAGEFGDPAHVEALRRGAEALSELRGAPGDPLAGLYVGEAGVAAALLRAGQVLGDPGLIADAARRARAVADHPVGSPDVFHGAAGRLLIHLLLWDETQDPAALRDATRMGDVLLERREGGPGAARWRIPQGYADLSQKCHLGYAHGAAGIADALLDLFEATAELRFADAALDATSWIVGQARPVLDDGSGLGWPQTENGPPHPPFWCHGATGIGRLLLHAARLGMLSDADDVLARTAAAVAQGARWSGPTLCHGLAGNLEFLLDVALATGDGRYRDDADELLSLANAFLVESDEGCAWISDAPRQISPDHLVGYGGIALAYLRRARPDRPHALSREGFRYRPPVARGLPRAPA
ncbi:MAG: hypothetical protein QOI73_2197 [Solirubrobacteraceae bacterium]|nr:hypothetical protein [Solirubrobacteraceae bacterium]